MVLAWGLDARPAVAGEVGVDGARVHWEDGLDGLGRTVAARLPEVRAEVARRFGWDELRDVEVHIVRGQEGMRRAAGADVPEWAVGVAVGSRRLLALRSDLLERRVGGGAIPVLRHEWFHLAWAQRAGASRRRLPLWAEEGIAEEIGGAPSVDAGAQLDIAAAFGRLLDFEDLETSFPRKEGQAGLAYRQSRSWVRHLTGAVGWPTLVACLEALLEDPAPGAEDESAWDAVLRTRTGRGLGAWHAAWRIQVEEEAAPWFHLLFRDVGWLLVMLAALLAVGLFGYVRRRRRRQIEALPDGPG